MYGIALSVAACLRGGTRVDVAWSLDPGATPRFDPTDAVAITPGGGRLGSLLDGALDSRLVELASAKPTEGRVVTVDLTPIEAEVVGVATGTTVRVLLAPADTLPEPLWDHLLEREPIGLLATVDGGRVTATELAVEERAGAGPNTIDEATVATWFRPTPTLVLAGGGPIVDALATAARFVGWRVETGIGTETAIGLAASLSPIDGLVVLGHDTEATGRVLQAALGSRVGYIGSIGPAALQEARGDWLAYRGVTDTGRIRGPAGIDIGARRPEEVAIAVVAEMISVQSAQ
ncbi:MAG: XdhC family protein [Actinomycetota bacterium]